MKRKRSFNIDDDESVSKKFKFNEDYDIESYDDISDIDELEIFKNIRRRKFIKHEKAKINNSLNSVSLSKGNKKMIKKAIKKAVNSGRLFDTLNNHVRDKCEEEKKNFYVPKMSEAGTNPKYWHKKTSGDEIVKNIRKTLDEFGYTRTDQQKIFHEQMINACIPKIYGDELDFHADRILRENEWKAIMQELLCVTPRRFGKTWAVAMFVAAILICVPYIEVVIFSMALRASRKMLALVDKFISRHPKGNKMICRPHNQERLTLRGDCGPDDERFCLSFPGRSDTTRGFNADIIVIDEAAYINYDLLVQTIIPVLMQSTTCLIAITTPRESEHFFSGLLRLVDPDTGDPLFNILRIGDPCDACKKTETPWLCSHKTEELPPWKSMKKQSKFLPIYEGNEHLNLREQWGMEADSTSLAFKKERVKSFAERELYSVGENPKVIWLASDPAGAGRSEHGICGAYFDGGKMIIIYLDAAILKIGTALEESERLNNAIKLIRTFDQFKNAPIVFIPENDPGKSTSHAPYHLQNAPDVLTMRECKGRKFGVPKRDDTTYEMQYLMQGLLACGDIYFFEELTSLSHSGKKMKEQLIKQLGSFVWDVEPARNNPDKVTVKLTGKKSGSQDDLLIATLMIPYWRRIFMMSDFEDYVNFRNHYLL